MFPILLSVVILSVAWWWLTRGYPFGISNRQGLWDLTANRLKSIENAADRYGLKKALPLAALFAFLMALHIFGFGLRAMGQLVPIQFIIRPYVQVANHQDTRFVEAWKRYPERLSQIDFYDRLLNQALASPDETWAVQKQQIRSWQDDVFAGNRRLDLTKGYLVAFTILLLVARKFGARGVRVVSRWFGLMSLTALVGSIHLMNYLYSEDQTFLAKQRLVSEFAQPIVASRQSEVPSLPGPEIYHKPDESWWAVEIGISRRFKWFISELEGDK